MWHIYLAGLFTGIRIRRDNMRCNLDLAQVEIMTYSEAAKYLGIQVATLKNLVASGKIQRTKITGTVGRRRLVQFDRADLDLYRASRYIGDRKFMRGSRLTHAVNVTFSDAEFAEICSAIPDGYSRSAWIAEAAIERSRLTSRK